MHCIRWGSPNGERLPAQHSLNLRLEWAKTFGRGRHRLECFVDVWNLYNFRPAQDRIYPYCAHPNPTIEPVDILGTGRLIWPGLRLIWNAQP